MKDPCSRTGCGDPARVLRVSVLAGVVVVLKVVEDMVDRVKARERESLNR